MYLYKISFPKHLTAKCYIGITSQTLKKRFKGHCRLSSDSLVSRAIKKHGKGNSIITVFGECDSWELLCLAEIEAIEKFNTFAPNGYNLTKGGEGLNGHVFTELHKKRISLAQTGKIIPEKSRELMSIAGKNKVFSDEHLRKFKENHIKGESHHRFGKGMPTHIAEALLKANLGRKLSDETKEKIAISSANRSNETLLKLSKASRDKPRTSISGFKGVYKPKGRSKWRARCRVMGKENTLGFFDTAEEASAVYQNFVASIHLPD